MFLNVSHGTTSTPLNPTRYSEHFVFKSLLCSLPSLAHWCLFEEKWEMTSTCCGRVRPVWQSTRWRATRPVAAPQPEVMGSPQLPQLSDAVRWWGALGLETTLGRKPSWPQHLGGLKFYHFWIKMDQNMDHGLTPHLGVTWCYLVLLGVTVLSLDIILCQHGPLNEDPRLWARGAAHSHDHLRELCRMLKDPAAGPVKGRVPSDAFGEESLNIIVTSSKSSNHETT